MGLLAEAEALVWATHLPGSFLNPSFSGVNMNSFFCADESCQADESPIGSAATHQTYILIECPPPWASHDFESAAIPNNLKRLEEDNNHTLRSVRCLLIYNDQYRQENCVRVFTLHHQPGLSSGYTKQEFQVPTLNDVASLIRDYLAGKPLDKQRVDTSTREILVCTHGSHDKCCAKYGIPFYRNALTLLNELSLDRVRIWQSSHFSGHRFAPTVLDFPEGRYYGRLSLDTFRTILTRTGDLHCFDRVYRGWGILPDPVQVLERELLFKYGWDWFNYRVNYRILEQWESCLFNDIEFMIESPSERIKHYRAEVVADAKKTLRLHGECSSAVDEIYDFPQFQVKNLVSVD